MAPIYVTQSDYSAYAAPTTVTDSAELDRILERAERDVDAFVGPWTVETNGRKFGSLATNPKALTAQQQAALKNAVCAQAFYRIQNGEEWALGGGDLYESANGPDFSTTSRRPRFSPQARQELRGSGLVIRGARAA